MQERPRSVRIQDTCSTDATRGDTPVQLSLLSLRRTEYVRIAMGKFRRSKKEELHPRGTMIAEWNAKCPSQENVQCLPDLCYVSLDVHTCN